MSARPWLLEICWPLLVPMAEKNYNTGGSHTEQFSALRACTFTFFPTCRYSLVKSLRYAAMFPVCTSCYQKDLSVHLLTACPKNNIDRLVIDGKNTIFVPLRVKLISPILGVVELSDYYTGMDLAIFMMCYITMHRSLV